MSRRKLGQAAAFLVTVLAVTAVVTAGSLAGDAEREAPSYPEYDAPSLLTDPAPAEGEVTVEPTETSGVVAIDRSEGNRFTTAEIEPLVAAITDAGYEVIFIESSSRFEEGLARADALVVIDPRSDYRTEAVDQIETFTDNGGRLLLLGEPTKMTLQQGVFGSSVTTERPQLSSLASRYGIQFGADYLYNMEQMDGNFQNILVEPARANRLTSGIGSMALYAATSVTAPDGQSVLLAAEGTRSSRTDAPAERPVAVRTGNVVAVGDTSFIERENYNVADNEQFIGNLVRFLVGGNRDRSIHDYPAFVDWNPTVRYTSVELLHAAQLLGHDLRPRRGQPTMRLSRGAVDPAETDVLITTYDYLEEHDLETDIITTANRLRIAGYESRQTGVYVIHKPAGPLDLVIVSDDPDRTQLATEAFLNDIAWSAAVSKHTIVERTSASGSPGPQRSSARNTSE